MKRLLLALLVVLDGAASGVRADPVPIIVTYELKKERAEGHAMAKDPRAFWMRQVVIRIDEVASARAAAPNRPGLVQVKFVVARSGSLVSAGVTASSGDPQLDRQAVAMVKRAEPFPPMPSVMDDATMSFALPVRFR